MSEKLEYTFNELFVLWCIANGFDTWDKIVKRSGIDKSEAGDVLATLTNHEEIELQGRGRWVIV